MYRYWMQSLLIIACITCLTRCFGRLAEPCRPLDVATDSVPHSRGLLAASASIKSLKGVVNLTEALDSISGCIIEENTNYIGKVVENIGNVSSAAACCELAENNPEANAWTYCPNPNDCHAKYYQFAYQQCNLKFQQAVAEGSVPFLYEQMASMPLSSGLPPKTWKTLSKQLGGQSQRPNSREPGSTGCIRQDQTIYDGIVVQDGLNNIQPNEEACCQACRNHSQCNVWVYCPLQETFSENVLVARTGCDDPLTGIVATPQSCTLKYQAPVSMVSAAPVVVGQGTVLEPLYGTGLNITFVSGAPIMLANHSLAPEFDFIGFRDIPLGDIPCPGLAEFENAWVGPYCRVVNQTLQEVADLCLDLPLCMGFAYMNFGDGNSNRSWTPLAYLKGNMTWDSWFSYLNSNYTQRQAIAFYSRPIDQAEAALQRQAAAMQKPPPTEDTDSGGGLSAGAIVGIVLGCVAAAAALALVVFLVIRRKCSAKAYSCHLETSTGKDVDGGASCQPYGPRTPSSKYHSAMGTGDTQITNPFDITELTGKAKGAEYDSSSAGQSADTITHLLNSERGTVISRRSVNRAALLDAMYLTYPDPPVMLGKGGFGCVWVAKYKDEPVAVKDLITSITGSADDMLVRLEAIIAEVRALKHCTHPNIVRCFGVVATTYPLKLLYELCDTDLYKAITSNEKQQWQWMNRGASVALDVARGLHYMHTELRMTHCDVKSHNILLKQGQAKLGDMGLVRILKEDEEQQHHSKLPCSPAYAAPEQMMHKEVSFAIDCFSFGVVMMELLMGEPAPVNRRYPVLQPGVNCPQEIVELVNRCMDNDPGRRPKLSEVCSILEEHVSRRAG